MTCRQRDESPTGDPGYERSELPLT